MKNKTVVILENAIQKGAKFASFEYTKENGDKSKRLVCFGVKMAPAFAKRGITIKGTGNWHKNKTTGKFDFAIKRGGRDYVRGVDMKDDKVKIFCVDGIKGLSIQSGKDKPANKKKTK